MVFSRTDSNGFTVARMPYSVLLNRCFNRHLFFKNSFIGSSLWSHTPDNGTTGLGSLKFLRSYLASFWKKKMVISFGFSTAGELIFTLSGTKYTRQNKKRNVVINQFFIKLIRINKIAFILFKDMLFGHALHSLLNKWLQLCFKNCPSFRVKC